MAVHTIFALINEGEVQNTVVGEYTDCDQAAKSMYGQEAFAVDVTQIPVQIGDSYDGAFHRVVNGETITIDPIPTDSQQIAALTASNEELRAYVEQIATALLDLAEVENG